MAHEIFAPNLTVGATYYATVRRAGTIYRTDTQVFEAPLAANWADYAVAVAPEFGGSTNYVGDFPTAIVTAGDSTLLVYRQAGGAPASTDPLAAGPGALYWDGTQEAFPPVVVSNLPAGGIVIQMTVASAAGAIGNGATLKNVAITRATDCPWLFTFSNSDGTAKDITGVTAELLVKRNVNDLDGAALITLSTANGRITLPTPANGQMFANIVAADTYELPVNGTFSLFPNECSYVYGLKVWNLGGQQVAEAAGRFTVVPFAVQSRTSP